MLKFIQEKDDDNKDAIIGSLCCLLYGDNFSGKRLFVGALDGLKFIECLLTDSKDNDRIKKKVLIIINDLVYNDQNIVKTDPTFVRWTFG